MEKLLLIVTNKRIWVLGLACLCLIGLILACADPIVIDIREEGTEFVGGKEPGKIFSFYYDEFDGAWYYLTSGDLPYDVTVVYLNNRKETLIEALDEGHITIDDLDRFDIDYVVKYVD